MTASKDQFEATGLDVTATGATHDEALQAWAKKAKLSPHTEGVVVTQKGKDIVTPADEHHANVAANITAEE